MRLFLLGWLLAGFTLTVATDSTQLGLRIVTRETGAAGARETTTYIRNDWVRVESRRSSHDPGSTNLQHQSVHIRRCDLNRILILNPLERTYLLGPLRPPLKGFQRFALSFGKPRQEALGPPEVVVETTTVDTGQRRMAFGHSARRVLTTRRERTLASGATRQTQVDGWYIDLDRGGCELQVPAFMTAVSALADASTNRPRVSFRNAGKTETGFPIERKETLRSGADVMGPPSTVNLTKVNEVSWQPLDPGLFEVPPDFRPEAGFFSGFADRYSETKYILQSIVASWFH